MTAREVYEDVLVELNKENAPSFTIEEFNYLLNKSILALVNEKYNFYASNQQLSDDLRVLLKNASFNIDYDRPSTDLLVPTVTYNPIRSYVLTTTTVSNSTTDIPVSLLTDIEVGSSIKFGGNDVVYKISAINDAAYPYSIRVATTDGLYPDQFTVLANTQLYIETPVLEDEAIEEKATEDRIVTMTLPSSDYLHILSCRVFWKGIKPNSSKNAYLVFPAKRLTFDILNAVENNTYLRPAANRPYFKVRDNQMNSGVEKLAGDLAAYRAYQNKPTLDVHVGRKRVSMYPTRIEIDYLKLPEPIVLDDIDIFTAGNDTSQSLELPDYLKNEIVRRVSAYLLEKIGDPRISTQPQLNQEIPTVPINMQQAAADNQQQGR